MTTYFLINFLFLALGVAIGFLYKGIHITIVHKDKLLPEEDVKYNESLVGELDPDVRQYYENTRGLNNF